MLVHHGTDFYSAQYIRKRGIDLSKGEWTADFGLGFYLSTQKGVAKRRASQVGFRKGQRGAILTYELDISDLTILKPTLKEWEDIVLGFRQWGSKYEESLPAHDCIMGPIADGKIAVMLELLMADRITEQDFRDGLKAKLPGMQIALKTEKAINALTFREECVL
jgi:hypothetical protein